MHDRRQRLDPFGSRNRKHPGARAPDVLLVPVASGVAAGRMQRLQGDTLAQWWTLFVSREQVDACLTQDPLRFENPVLFEQIRREFDHAFDSSTSPRDPESAR